MLCLLYILSFIQSHLVKKSNKWDCKMCGDKQSLMKVFGEGTGKECRLHVQKLNTMRMVKERDSADSVEAIPSHLDIVPLLGIQQNLEQTDQTPSFTSKWAKYIESPTKTIEPEGSLDQSLSNDLQYVLELPEKKQKPKTSVKLANNKNMFIHSPASKGKRKSDQLNEDCNNYDECLDNKFIECFTDEDIPYNKPQKSRDIPKLKSEMVVPSSSKWAKYIVDTNTADE